MVKRWLLTTDAGGDRCTEPELLIDGARRDVDIVLATDYDALAAELTRCRAAIAHDMQAMRRIADLEAALDAARRLYEGTKNALNLLQRAIDQGKDPIALALEEHFEPEPPCIP